MTDFILSDEQIIHRYSNHKIIAFGAGRMGHAFWERFHSSLHIKCFIDNFVRDNQFHDIPVYSADYLHGYAEEDDIIIITNHRNNVDILRQTTSMGYKQGEQVFLWDTNRESFDFINEGHFSSYNYEDARKLFANSIRLIEIEVFSYCNRQCWFCPNSFLDRHSKNLYLSEETYLNLLKSLSQVGYKRKVSFSRYNEPLSDKIIIKRIAQAHKLLPQAVLHTNTNGDYLTKEYLVNLYDAGLRSINIQVYSNTIEYVDDYIFNQMDFMLRKLDLPYKVSICVPHQWHESVVYYRDMDIHIYGRNFLYNGCNRGESIKTIPDPKDKRTSPCLQPFHSIYIDYNGNVMPCCNLRSDNPRMRGLILGNLNQQSLFSIYGGPEAVKWRTGLFNYREKHNYPCRYCNFDVLPNQETDYQLWKEKHHLVLNIDES